MNKELLEYIKRERANKVDDKDIAQKLEAKGWKKFVIESALSGNDAPAPPPEFKSDKKDQEVYGSTDYNYSLWDAFKHILMFISLCVYAVSLNITQHYFIENVFGSSSSSFRNYFYREDTVLQIAMAAMTVTFPIFIYLFLILKKQTLEDPKLKEFKIRKRLIYATLVVTFVIVLSNVINIIFRIFSGALLMINLVHFLSPVMICVVIFSHFIKEARRMTEK